MAPALAGPTLGVAGLAPPFAGQPDGSLSPIQRLAFLFRRKLWIIDTAQECGIAASGFSTPHRQFMSVAVFDCHFIEMLDY